MAKLELTIPDRFLFMKVGDHAGETFDEILARKRQERDRAGCIFWGYGGSACHPLSQVQPFFRLASQEGHTPVILMNSIRPTADPEVFPAAQYSEDGVTWKDIPRGVQVTGSRYAIILDEIQPGDFLIDLRGYQVGIGPSRGRVARDYLQGRTDKACLVKTEAVPGGLPLQNEQRRADFIARLKEPFAVLLR